MKVNTRVFGEIEIENARIIRFVNGIVGFPDLTEFVLLHDEDRGNQVGIRWLQSLQETAFALPVMDPLIVVAEYNPEVEDELLKPLGEWSAESLLVLVTVTLPKDLKHMSINLQAPLIINADEKKAAQIIVDTEKYPVKYPIYDLLQELKKAGE